MSGLTFGVRVPNSGPLSTIASCETVPSGGMRIARPSGKKALCPYGS